MSVPQDKAWSAARADMWMVLANLQFAIDAEQRCGDKDGLVSQWNKQVTCLTDFYSDVVQGDLERAQESWLKVDADSRERVPARIRDWVLNEE